jgi:hypothetical protein
VKPLQKERKIESLKRLRLKEVKEKTEIVHIPAGLHFSIVSTDQRFVENGTLRKSHSAYWNDAVRVDKSVLLECRDSSVEAVKLDENKFKFLDRLVRRENAAQLCS